FNTPAAVGSEPNRMALSDDGQVVYVSLNGTNQIVRLNLLSQQLEASLSLNPYGSTANVMFAVQPGSENTLAATLTNPSIPIFDFDPVSHTAAARPSNSGSLSYAANPQFLDASTLLTYNGPGQQFSRYPVTSSGIPSAPTSVFAGLPSSFKLV